MSARFEKADQRLHMVVMFSSLENQLHSHAKTWVHGLHHALNAQFEILRTHEDFDARP